MAFETRLNLALNAVARGQEAQVAQRHLDAAAAIPGNDRINPPGEMRVAMHYTRARVQSFQADHASLMTWLHAAILECGRDFGGNSPRCLELRRIRPWPRHRR